jgi:hypothetical protein
MELAEAERPSDTPRAVMYSHTQAMLESYSNPHMVYDCRRHEADHDLQGTCD